MLAPFPHSDACPLSRRGRDIADSTNKHEGTSFAASGKASTWCHFSQRVGIPSFQKAADPTANARKKSYVDWKFSFVALGRAQILGTAPSSCQDGAKHETVRKAVNWGRLIRHPMKRSGHVIVDMCNAHGSIERRIVAKSHGAVGGYRIAREAGWGDAFCFDKFDKEKARQKRASALTTEHGAEEGAEGKGDNQSTQL